MKRHIASLAGALVFSLVCMPPARAEQAGTPTPAPTGAAANAAVPADKQTRIDQMVYAASIGDNAKLMSLLQGGIDVNAIDSYKNAALIAAVNTNVKDTVKFLIQKGANVNFRRETDGWSALTFAAYFGFDDIAKMLLDAGADPNLKNNYGETAIFHAASMGQEGCVQLLLAHGADPTPKNDKGYDALRVAQSRMYTGIAQKIEAAIARMPK